MQIDAQLELTIVFSEELGTESYSKIVDIIKNNSGERFQRGVFNTNRMFLNFASKEEMSPFIVSLIKRLSEGCREYRIGVRDYYVPSYELSFDCGHVGKLKIPYTEAVICNGKVCKVAFKDIEKDFLRRGSIGRVMYLIYSKTRDKTWKLISKNDLSMKGSLNPYEEIEKNNLVKKGLVKDEYFYLPDGARQISKLKAVFLDSLNQKISLQEFFPLSHTAFSLAETEELIDSAPPELFKSVFCEVENSQEAFEAYFITGSIKSVNAKPKGFLFDEIPFNLYKAMEKTEITSPIYLYSQRGPKLFLTFFDGENYESAKENVAEEIKNIFESLNLNYRIISRNVNSEIIRFECYLPYSKAWLTIAELVFSKDSYTKPFQIKGNSGQVNINLENILLSQISQGVFSTNAVEEKEAEEIPTNNKPSFQDSELLE